MALALALALAAPGRLPALAQDVAAQKGDDAQPAGPQPDAPPTVNRTEAAEPPAGEAPPPDAPPVGLDKRGDKGLVLDGAAAAGPDGGADAGDNGAPADNRAAAGDRAVGDGTVGDGTVGDGAIDGAVAEPAVADADDAVAAIPIADVDPDDQPRGVPARLANWVRYTRDNGKRPFAIIDKLHARIWVFAPDGTLLAAAPVLVGLARGDDSEAGIGDKALAAISPKERTTPAGRFVARFGPASGAHKTVLWVDYADAISLHPVVTTNPKEHRLKRIKSADAADHRISFGCINVPAEFYDKFVATSFRKRGGVVYVLPDTKPIEDVFPAFAASMGADAATDPASQASADEAAPDSDRVGVYPAATDPLAVDPPSPASADLLRGDPAGDAPDQAVATEPAPTVVAAAPKHSRRHGATARAHPVTAAAR